MRDAGGVRLEPHDQRRHIVGHQPAGDGREGVLQDGRVQRRHQRRVDVAGLEAVGGVTGRADLVYADLDRDRHQRRVQPHHVQNVGARAVGPRRDLDPYVVRYSALGLGASDTWVSK